MSGFREFPGSVVAFKVFGQGCAALSRLTFDDRVAVIAGFVAQLAEDLDRSPLVVESMVRERVSQIEADGNYDDPDSVKPDGSAH
jgi:hypothetical protein